jgi:hypothetical protein
VTVALGDERSDVYDEVELDEAHPRSIFTAFQLHDPPDEFPWSGCVASPSRRCGGGQQG